MEESKESFKDIFIKRKEKDTIGYFDTPAIQKAYFIGAYAKAVINSSYYSDVSNKNTTYKNWLSNQIINYRNLDRIFEMAFRFEQKLKLKIKNEVRRLAEGMVSDARGLSSAKISYAFVTGFDDYSQFTKSNKDHENKEESNNE